MPSVDIDTLRNIFLTPEVNTDYDIKWKKVNYDGLVDFMCNEHNFSETRVVNSADKLKKLSSSQRSLEDWF